MRVNEIITEAFNTPYAFTWEKSDGAYDALAKLDDGTNLSININEEYDGEGRPYWHVEFWRNNSLEITGEGDAYRIFATVLSAIQEFINMERPKRVTFSADKEPGESRAELYDRLVQRYAAGMGFSVEIENNGLHQYYILSRRFNMGESDPEIDEGWKDWVAGAAMGAAALGAHAAPKHQPVKAPTAHVQKVQMQKITPEQSRNGASPQELKAYVEAMAQKYLPANQVAQFVGQVAHETGNFTSMIERNPEKNLKHYAKAKNPLGNKGMEDAQKYIGRGFLQITGKYNYKYFGDKIRVGLGDELLKNPDLAMRKDVAIALAVMFWRERVAPKMVAGASNKEIATAINGRKPKGLDSRAQAVKVASANMTKPKSKG
jgi:predicted chitinase